ncbi:MAG: GntR family transcriptional regulator [Bilifractor sp.]
MVAIDYQDRRPIYEQIVAHYEMLILKGVLQPDEKIPSVRQMAQELSINPNTIQKAFTVLEKEGYIYTVKGRGNFVSGDFSSLAKQKQNLWKEKMRGCLREGKEIGIDRESSIQLVNEIYGGEKK